MAPNSLPLVETERFSGPIDLLVDEVRRQNVDLEQIDLAPLTARFLAYVRLASLPHLNLDMEWLHMAATLIQWKSRALLPRDPQTKPKDPLRDELIDSISRHKREAAEALGERKQQEDTRFSPSRGFLFERDGSAEEPDDTAFLSVFDLVLQARDLACWIAEYRSVAQHWSATFDITPETATIVQMSNVQRARLRQTLRYLPMPCPGSSSNRLPHTAPACF